MVRVLLRGPLLVAITVTALASAGNSAEIQKLMQMCPGQKLCAWYRADVAPPKGWVEDKEFGGAHFITALLPDQPKLGPEAPLIYIQVGLHQDHQTLEENIAQNQGIWRKSEPKAKITPLPDAPRGGGKPPFKVFLYENPTHPKQAFELTAFAAEPQPDGSHYIITVVDTASNRKAIDASREAFLAVLGGL